MPSKAYEAFLDARHICAAIGANAALHAAAWGKDYTLRSINSGRNELLSLIRVDMMGFIKLTRDEALTLGFREHDRRPGLYVIPTWAWWVIPPAGNFEAVSGMQHRYHISSGEMPSTDTRQGYLCFGVRFHIDGSMDIGA